MTFKYEKEKIKQGYKFVVCCDEVGRGCLAGPVVAAAVIMRSELLEHKPYISNFLDVKDSKKLTATKRKKMSEIIKANCLWSIAEVSSEEIDKINIHHASLLAMKKAVEGLFCSGVILNPSASEGEESQQVVGKRSFTFCTPQDDAGGGFIFVDGKFPIPNLPIPQQTVIGGDNKVLSIAAASIIAKVYRDNLMREFDKQYPNYKLAKHKGYATLQHRTALKKHGLTPLHRLTFCGQYL